MMDTQLQLSNGLKTHRPNLKTKKRLSRNIYVASANLFLPCQSALILTRRDFSQLFCLQNSQIFQQESFSFIPVTYTASASCSCRSLKESLLVCFKTIHSSVCSILYSLTPMCVINCKWRFVEIILIVFHYIAKFYNGIDSFILNYSLCFIQTHYFI